MAATILLDNDSSVPLIGSSLDEKKGDLKSRTVEELKERLKAIESNPDFKKFQDWNDTGVHYKDDFTCYRKTTSAAFSIIVIVAIGATIVALGLLFSNHFFSFPHDFMSFFQNVNYTKFALMGGIPLILVTGAGIVIYRAVTRQEKLLGKLEVTYIDLQTHEKKVVQIDSLTDLPKSTEEKPISIKKIKKIDDVSEAPERGEFRNVGDHLKTVLLKCQLDNGRVSKRDAYIDMSTVNANCNKALMYSIKPRGNHYFVSTVVPLAIPYYMIADMFYQLLRAVIVPFYVLFQYIKEKCTGKVLFPEERAFELLDAPKECLKSLWRVIKAPFYALAYLFAALYSLVNPMGGRKLGSAIERDWNESVSLEEGFWSIQCEGSDFWHFEGGGGPLGLGRNGFFLAGCWQPIGIVEFNDDGTVKTAYRMEATFTALGEKPYNIVYLSDIEHVGEFEFYTKNLKALNEEYSNIRAEIKERKKSKILT